MLGDDPQLAGQLHAGRAAADHHERHPLRCSIWIARALGLLECAVDPIAQVERVRERLQPAGHLAPLVFAEVGGLGSAGDDQAVVVQPLAAVEDKLAVLDVEAGRLAHQDGDVRVAPERGPDRRGALAGGQPAAGHLVEQRLEQMVVGAVHERHVHVCVPQLVRGRQPAEAAADDYDAAAVLACRAMPRARVRGIVVLECVCARLDVRAAIPPARAGGIVVLGLLSGHWRRGAE